MDCIDDDEGIVGGNDEWRDGKGGEGIRPELFVKGCIANGSKESRRGERVIGENTWPLSEQTRYYL